MNLTIENLTKSFGEKKALDIDYYSIHSGELIGLVGNNGAGKTTLFRIILDLLKADTGCVTIDGIIDGMPVSCDTSKSEDWKSYTGAFVDTSFLIDYLTPEEYFRFIAKISGISDEVMNDRLLQFDSFMNGEVLGQKTLIRNLSMGNKQKVGIASAIIPHTDVIILDEPFNYLDPTSQVEANNMLKKEAERGALVIVSTHNLAHVTNLCTRVLLMERSEIIRDIDNTNGEAQQILSEYFKI